MKSGILRAGSLAISLSVLGCSQLPPFPEVWQCQFNGSPRAFYCVNSKTKERLKLNAESEVMRGAQCLSADDYLKSEAWVEFVKSQAEKRCN
jgi:hypothetical protein